MAIHGHVANVVLVGKYQPRWNGVLALARVLVVLSLVVVLVALAIEAARCVGAVLRAGTWLFQAFIYIGARFAVGQESVRD